MSAAPTSISICIASHNCGRYLRSTIESVLALRPPANEIIVSDDHSTDDSAAILRDYEGDPRLAVVHQSERLSLGEHYRFLLLAARSDYVCFLSADDVMRTDFIAVMRRGLIDGISLVIGGCVETDAALRAIRTRGTGYRPLMPPPAGFGYMAPANNYTMSFALMRRDILLGAPILPRAFDLVTDWFWALWLARAGTVKVVTKPVGYYRIHDDNAGHANDNWGLAAREMVTWLRPQLDDTERRMLTSGTGHADPAASSRLAMLKAAAKDMIKRLDAVRYRSLPPAVRRVQQQP